MATKGTGVLDFGSAPGTNIATLDITGQGSIGATSYIEAWMMSEATATNNAYEHTIARIKLTAGNIVAGTGFTIYGVSHERLSGTYNIRWVWS